MYAIFQFYSSADSAPDAVYIRLIPDPYSTIFVSGDEIALVDLKHAHASDGRV
jgi:hypothetical protein